MLKIFSPHRPSRADPAHVQAVRRRIMAQLSESIKIVQHEFSSSETPITSCESTNELCCAFEALFIHGLRDTFLELMSSAWRDSRRPEPNFLTPLMVVTHRVVLNQVTALSQIRTDIGKCRAWLRTAINDSMLSSYLKMLAADQRMLGFHWEKYALIRDREQMDVLLQLLQGLETMQFQLACNSSLLNAWDEAPLELSGVYFRPRSVAAASEGAVMSGADIAATLEEPEPRRQPPPGHQLPLPDSPGTTLILNALDPDLAFDVIMRSTSVDSLPQLGATPPAGKAASPSPAQAGTARGPSSSPPVATPQGALGSGCSSEASSLAGEVAQLTSPPPPPAPPPPPQEQSYVAVLESYRESSPRARSLMTTPDVQFLLGGRASLSGSSGRGSCGGAPSGGSSPREADARAGGPGDSSNPPEDEGPTAAAEGTTDDSGTAPPLPEAEGTDGIDSAAADDSDAAEEEPESPLLPWLTQIATEVGLDGQNYTCAGCPRFVGMLYGQPRLCGLDARFYCSDCLPPAGPLAQLPARMLHNWDFTRYPVSEWGRAFLDSVDARPLMNVAEANPSLYDVSADMDRVRVWRTKLVFLGAFLRTCRSAAFTELCSRLAGRMHLCEHVHLYAPVDLREVRVGSLQSCLQSLANFAEGHVLSCSLCSQKGFVCEFCRDAGIIYPFQLETTRQCQQCCALYHAGCWQRPAPCPRCQRYRRRAELRRLLEEPQPAGTQS